MSNINMIKNKLSDNIHTTFINVCIPEFSSVFETERFIQSMFLHDIDSNIIIVNQIIDCKNGCTFCTSRKKMQIKYLDIIKNLYSNNDTEEYCFDIIYIPLQEIEIRSLITIQNFSKNLYN